MKNFNKRCLFRPLMIYLIISFIVVAVLPTDSLALFVSSAMSQKISSPLKSMKGADLNTIQKVVESKIIGQRLSDLGLNPQEIKDRLDQLSDEEIHQFATQLESLNAGGAAWQEEWGDLFIIILAIIVLISWLVLFFPSATNK